MPQLSLYLTQEQLLKLENEAKEDGMSLSKWVVSQIINRIEPRYPEGWADLFGSVLDNTFTRPDQPQVEKFLKPFEIVPFSDEMTAEYADIRSELERIGKPIGGNDYLIVALTRSNNGILVTHNVDEFSRINNLKIEDWVVE